MYILQVQSRRHFETSFSVREVDATDDNLNKGYGIQRGHIINKVMVAIDCLLMFHVPFIAFNDLSPAIATPAMVTVKKRILH